MKKLWPFTLLGALLLIACTPEAASPTATPPPSPLPATATEVPTAEPILTPTPLSDIQGPPPTSALVDLYTEEEDRSAYQVWDLAEPARQPFWDEYETAVATDAAWPQDPHEVTWQFVDQTMRFSDEPFPYEEVFYLAAPPGEAIFIVILGEYLDDSVWGNKIRVELVEQDGIWQIVWAGDLWRCRRGGAELEQNWHTTLCP
jgi:hypothetical protein